MREYIGNTSYQHLEMTRHSPQAIGDRICELRKAKEYTQSSLSKVCGISQQTVAALESGRVADPRHLPVIASTLNVSVEYLRYGRSKGCPILSNGSRNDSFPRPGVDVSPTTKMLQIVPKHSPRAFAFELDDDACKPHGIHKHDIIAVDPDVEAAPGTFVCIRYKEMLSVRRLRELDSAFIFVTDNEDWGPLDSNSAELIGSVIQVVRTF